MKQRSFTEGVTIYMSAEMYTALRALSDQEGISISEVIRTMIERGLNGSATDSRPGGKQ